MTARAQDRSGGAPERRIVALDGVRGLMTVAVVLSHYFAEIRGGFPSLAVGWVAVDVFFVLSGLLVGRLILEKGHHANFLAVFYARRACRTFPVYFACLAVALVLAALVPALWRSAGVPLPLWSYAAFVQNVFMVSHGDIGTEWLAPTWTLAVEEQFYLVVPALMLATPRRWTMPLLAAIALGAILARLALTLAGATPLAALALLPTRADSLAIGLMAAVALHRSSTGAGGVDWAGRPARSLAVGAVAAALAVTALGGQAAITVAGHALVSVAGACFLLTLIADAPEAARFKGRALRFFGATSYATYLLHLPVLWLAHRLVLGAVPTLATPAAVAVTLACLPVTVACATLATRLVEEPITALGRRFTWKSRPAPVPAEAAALA